MKPKQKTEKVKKSRSKAKALKKNKATREDNLKDLIRYQDKGFRQ